jgi:VCBS repeat-containing protein
MAQQFSGLPMPALIGGPLKAAANANAAMAVTQTKFLLDTCFVANKTGGTDEDPVYSYTPIMLDMILERGVLTPASEPGKEATIQSVKTNFKLPMLTIIPLNSLGVDSADVTFEMEVKSSFSEEATQETTNQMAMSSSFSAKAGWGPFSVEIKGQASYDHKDSATHSTHYQKSNSAKYTVNVHAGQLPLPKGVNTIIEAYAQAIQPIELEAPKGKIESEKSSSGGGGSND